VYYVHPDHLDTPRTIVNAVNVVVWAWDSDAFGTTPAIENLNGLGQFSYSLRFPGQQFDANTGLYYNYFRDYDAANGRYIQSDPIGLEGGLATYSYVDSDPIAAFDPDGEIKIRRPSWRKTTDDQLYKRGNRCESCGVTFGKRGTGRGRERHHLEEWNVMRDAALPAICLAPMGSKEQMRLLKELRDRYQDTGNLLNLCENCHDDAHKKKRRYGNKPRPRFGRR
jgi:RHS repeat-associated protein